MCTACFGDHHLPNVCEHFTFPALVHTSAGQWSPTIYKTSRHSSLMSRFALVAEKSTWKSSIHCENGGCRGCSGGTTVVGQKMRFLGNQNDF